MNTELIEELSSLKGYSYKVWGYIVSHSVLKIRATKNKIFLPPNCIEITFAEVAYMQMPNTWTGDLKLSSDEEFYLMAQKLNLSDPQFYLEHVYKLFTAESPKDLIYILGKLVKIERP